MGLLDDAIREHLELMRRHGESDDRIRRLEQEALGPPRQAGSFAAAPSDDDPALAGPVPDDVLEPVDPDIDVPPAAEPPAPPLDPPAAEAFIPAEPPPDAAAEPPAAVPARPEPEPWLEDDPPAPAGEAAEPPPEDVLEETPEFLQETPEHDRLWFEQKPPRGFDIDR